MFMQTRLNEGLAPLCILRSGLMLGRNCGSESTFIHFVQIHSQRARVNFKLISIINVWFSYQEGSQSVRVRCVSLTPQNTMCEVQILVTTECNHSFALT